MSIADLYECYKKHPNIQTDTRKLQKGDIFFALKGPNFNGNLFAEKALELGAAYAVVDEVLFAANEKIIVVKDVLDTLQQLAKHHRQQFNIPFIAITGSNGKTTTKELVSTVLSTHYKTYTTKGNLNNHIGVPLTILSIGLDAEMAVIEMGANHQQEIASYCSYTLPTHGIITNCGKAHLEGFGGIMGVRKGKGELYDFLRLNAGAVFLYKQHDYLIEMSKGIQEVVTYGIKDADFSGEEFESDTFLSVTITKPETLGLLRTNLVGSYNLSNVLCAVAVGSYFNVPEPSIKQAIEGYVPTNSRSQMIIQGTNHIVLDAYNANPTSMKAAIENFAVIKTENKVLILGGMMELGEESQTEHQQIIDLINTYQWTNVVLVGGDFKHANHSHHYFDNASQAKNWFLQQQFSNTHILVKGSRSMQMEKVIEP
jgi:UDP-N-acetylmuramoyl-tripeptide--D-alanyl-D-alanine ligase